MGCIAPSDPKGVVAEVFHRLNGLGEVTVASD